MHNYGQFTGIPEIDFEILDRMPFNDLRSLCRTGNQYIYSLCQDEYYWKRRLRTRIGNAKIPTIIQFYQDMERPAFNWIEAYQAAGMAKQTIDDIDDSVIIKIELSGYNEEVLNLLKRHGIVLEDIEDIFIEKAKYPYIGYDIILNNIIIRMDHMQLLNLLFSLEYQGYVKDIKGMLIR